MSHGWGTGGWAASWDGNGNYGWNGTHGWGKGGGGSWWEGDARSRGHFDQWYEHPGGAPDKGSPVRGGKGDPNTWPYYKPPQWPDGCGQGKKGESQSPAGNGKGATPPSPAWPAWDVGKAAGAGQPQAQAPDPAQDGGACGVAGPGDSAGQPCAASPVGDGLPSVPPPSVRVPPIPGAPQTPQSRPVLNLEFFEQFQVHAHWSDHNIALKYGRYLCERNGTAEIVFPNDEPWRVAHCIHPKGTKFYFDDQAECTLWRWQEMVAHLTWADMDLVVHGPKDHRSRGLVS